jgi:hypothetical protein
MQARISTDAMAYTVILHTWLQWRCSQARQLILKGGAAGESKGSAGSAADVSAGLTVIQWGVTPSERVAKQLRGRAGRQGDPGQTFAVACVDDASMQRHYPAFGEFIRSHSQWCVPNYLSFVSTTPEKCSLLHALSDILFDVVPCNIAKDSSSWNRHIEGQWNTPRRTA